MTAAPALHRVEQRDRMIRSGSWVTSGGDERSEPRSTASRSRQRRDDQGCRQPMAALTKVNPSEGSPAGGEDERHRATEVVQSRRCARRAASSASRAVFSRRIAEAASARRRARANRGACQRQRPAATRPDRQRSCEATPWPARSRHRQPRRSIQPRRSAWLLSRSTASPQ